MTPTGGEPLAWKLITGMAAAFAALATVLFGSWLNKAAKQATRISELEKTTVTREELTAALSAQARDREVSIGRVIEQMREQARVRELSIARVEVAISRSNEVIHERLDLVLALQSCDTEDERKAVIQQHRSRVRQQNRRKRK